MKIILTSWTSLEPHGGPQPHFWELLPRFDKFQHFILFASKLFANKMNSMGAVKIPAPLLQSLFPEVNLYVEVHRILPLVVLYFPMFVNTHYNIFSIFKNSIKIIPFSIFAFTKIFFIWYYAFEFFREIYVDIYIDLVYIF